jgi:uncharacterized membrane protein YdbT with pleckstrin-like domain
MIKSVSSNSVPFLLPEEKIVLKANPHWLFLAIPMIEAFAFFLLYAFIACPFLGIMLHGLDWFCYFLSVFLLLFLIVVMYLDWKFNRLYLTNFRLIKERGIIGKRFLAIRLKKIQDITCDFGILGRLFGFGQLIIESAGTEGMMVFQGIHNPGKIKREIEIEASREGYHFG